MEEEFKIGELVKWWKSTYFIIDIVEGGAILKQNFSIGTISFGNNFKCSDH